MRRCRDARNRGARRDGVSQLEVLVAIGIIGLLLSIAIPAVLQSRAAAQAAQCRNNLTQIGVAIANYESRFQAFPPGRRGNAVAWRAILLADLDEKPLYDRILKEIVHPDDLPRHALNGHVVSVFVCPSDPAPARDFERAACASYSGNVGTGMHPAMLAPGIGVARDGVIIDPFLDRVKLPPVRLASIRDGASNTASVAEIMHGSFRKAYENDYLRITFTLPRSYVYRVDLVNNCRRIPRDVFRQVGWQGLPYNRGIPWLEGWIGDAMYNHALPPNSPSCSNGSYGSGIYSAASAHPGGAHVLFVDGHVQFVAESFDVDAWRQLGSRDGNSQQ
jgi:prepilin-type processing-associated H-X9-DG protein